MRTLGAMRTQQEQEQCTTYVLDKCTTTFCRHGNGHSLLQPALYAADDNAVLGARTQMSPVNPVPRMAVYACL